MNEYFDVAIIGAGPGGCASALALHDSGLSVVLIDKATFPRDKICGDAIPGMAFRAMDRINPEWGKEMRQFLGKRDIHSAKVYVPGRRTIEFNWVLYAYNSKRIDFDNFLLQFVRSKTNTTILENRKLENIIVNSDNVNCQFQDGSSLNAAVVIGCDGANSLVKRLLCKKDINDKNKCTAVRAYYQGVEGVKANANEFHFFKELLPGYFWIFPLENGWTNVGFGIIQNYKRKSKKTINLRDAMNNLINDKPEIAPRFLNATKMDEIKAYALPLGTKKRNISGERFMLCGDAASLIDPLQGHGIDNAMWSGLFAADQAKNCFKSNNFSAQFMHEYDNKVYEKLGSGLYRNYLIMRFFNRFPFLIDFLIKLGQNRKLTKWVLRKLKI